MLNGGTSSDLHLGGGILVLAWGILYHTKANPLDEGPALAEAQNTFGQMIMFVQVAFGESSVVRFPSIMVKAQWLRFGMGFNQSIGNVTLPSGLQSLEFGENFNQRCRYDSPERPADLAFGINFNQSMENVTLPSGLQS
jgi:hypothetical protein